MSQIQGCIQQVYHMWHAARGLYLGITADNIPVKYFECL